MLKKTIQEYVCIVLLPLLCGCVAAPIVVGAGGAGYAGYRYGQEKRRCPFCDKTISRKATVCRYCGNEVTPILKEKEKNMGETGNPAESSAGSSSEFVNKIN